MYYIAFEVAQSKAQLSHFAQMYRGTTKGNHDQGTKKGTSQLGIVPEDSPRLS